MLKIKDIQRVTPRVVKENAKKVRILSWKVKDIDTKDGKRKAFFCKVRSLPDQFERRKNTYQIRVEAVELDTPLHKANIRVYCGCDFHIYYGCADVLIKNGAGFKEYKTGIMPDMRNPRYIPFSCKHLFAVFQFIKLKKL